MPDFGRVITLAYMRILGRPPDPGGLDNYNRLMNMGMTEAQMRETLIRSPEYASKNPDVRAAASKGATTVKRAPKSGKKSKPGKSSRSGPRGGARKKRKN